MLSSYTFGMESNVESNGNALSSPLATPRTRQSPAQRKREFTALRDKLGDSVQDEAQFVTALVRLMDSGVNPRYFDTGDASSPINTIDWRSIPIELHVESGLGLGERAKDRYVRKRQQVTSMVDHAELLIRLWHNKTDAHKSKMHVVEFCGGSGYIILPLAYRFPNVEFVLVDFKDESVNIARERIAGASLTNVRCVVKDIGLFDEKFHLGIGLHACGLSTDVAIQKCLDANAAILQCPCCVGKITTRKSNQTKVDSNAYHQPKSQHYGEVLLCQEVGSSPLSRLNKEWLALVKAADFGHVSSDYYSYSLERETQVVGTVVNVGHKNRMRRLAKAFLEEDRCLHIQQYGYASLLTIMQPATASPKNDIIVAWPLSWENNSASNQKEGLVLDRLRKVECTLEQFLQERVFLAPKMM